MKINTHLCTFLSPVRLSGCASLIAMLGLGSLNGQTIWTGGGGDDAWNNAANWNPSTVPGNTVVAQLGDAAPILITVPSGTSQPRGIEFLGNVANDVTVQLASGTTWRLIAAGVPGAGVFVDTGAAYDQIVDLNGGTILLGQNTTAGAKYVSFKNNGTGTLTLSSGSIDVTATSGSYVVINLSFDGTGKVVVGSSLGQQTGSTGTQTLNILQSGSGTTTLSGTNTNNGTTTVSAGKLFIDGAQTGGGAYSITGGQLGGSGTITTAGNTGVTVGAGGKLFAGSENSVGTLTMNLGTGSLDLSGALAGDSSSLFFRLGTTSDQIVLGTGTTLNIGTDVLNFGDFVFSTEAGFGDGVYTLFESSTSIAGSLLSGQLTGIVGGLDAALSLSGDGKSLLLTVSSVPEPANASLLLGGLFGACAFSRRRRNAI